LVTFWELVRALVRYWPIVLVGALCTVGVGTAAISRDGVYFTRTSIAFLAPSNVGYSNAIRTVRDDVIETAGIVAKRVTGPGKVSKFAAPEVTLVGLGVRDGWSLRLPDTGGQWATNFATQALTLDVVGPTREQVEAQRAEVIQRVRGELEQLQRDAGVPPKNRITTMAVEATVIHYAGGNRPRTLGMTALLGTAATFAVVFAVDRRRRQREAAPPASPSELAVVLG
jgi:hypothetical protein